VSSASGKANFAVGDGNASARRTNGLPPQSKANAARPEAHDAVGFTLSRA